MTLGQSARKLRVNNEFMNCVRPSLKTVKILSFIDYIKFNIVGSLLITVLDCKINFLEIWTWLKIGELDLIWHVSAGQTHNQKRMYEV